MGSETFEAEGLTGMEVDGDLDVATAWDKEALLEGDGLRRIFLEAGPSYPELFWEPYSILSERLGEVELGWQP